MRVAAAAAGPAPAPPRVIRPRRLANASETQLIRRFLRPFEPPCLAIDAQAQAVLIARRDLTRPERAPRAVRETQQHLRVVIETAAGYLRGQVCGDLRHAQPRDELQEMEGVRPDIPYRAGDAALRRIDAPRGLLVAAGFERRGQPVLRILDLHDAQRAPSSPPAIISLACRTSG